MDQPGLGLGLVHKKVISICGLLGLVHKKVISICGLFSTSSGPLRIGARGASVAECRMHLLVLSMIGAIALGVVLLVA